MPLGRSCTFGSRVTLIPLILLSSKPHKRSWASRRLVCRQCLWCEINPKDLRGSPSAIQSGHSPSPAATLPLEFFQLWACWAQIKIVVMNADDGPHGGELLWAGFTSPYCALLILTLLCGPDYNAEFVCVCRSVFLALVPPLCISSLFGTGTHRQTHTYAGAHAHTLLFCQWGLWVSWSVRSSELNRRTSPFSLSFIHITNAAQWSSTLLM